MRRLISFPRPVKLILLVTLFLLPSLTSPLMTDPLNAPRAYLIILSTTAALWLTFFQPSPTTFLNLQRANFWSSAVLLSGLTFFVLLASLVSSQGRPTSLSGFSLWLIAAPVVYLLFRSLHLSDPRFKSRAFKAIIFSAVPAAATVFLFTAGKIGLNPFGSFAEGFVFFAAVGWVALGRFLSAGRRERLAILVSLLLSGLSLVLLATMTGKKMAADLPSSLETAYGSVLKFPLLGVGPGLYPTAFGLFRPLNFNYSADFPRLPQEGANLWLTLIPEYGLLGTLALLALVFRPFLSGGISRKSLRRALSFHRRSAPALIIFLSTFFVGIKPAMLYLLFALLALEEGRLGMNFKLPRTAGRLIILALGLFFLGLSFIASQNLMADIFYKWGNTEKPPLSYDLKLRAGRLNPRSDLYQRSLSQDSLEAAKALSQKGGFSLNERRRIEELIKTAAGQAKSAVLLNPKSSENLLSAAEIYSGLIGAVGNAASLSGGYFLRAQDLSPFDPRINLGRGVLESRLGSDRKALGYFEEALELKRDFIPALYNKAKTLARLKEKAQAVEIYRKLLVLIGDKDSEIYQKVDREIRQLQ